MEGKCHICGEEGKLTNEHVPPRKAFNSFKNKLYSGDILLKIIQSDAFPWNFSGKKFKEKQNGIGFQTLCSRCNNNTGSWYGPSFVDFVFQGMKQIVDVCKDYDKNKIKLKFTNIRPLRIVKQITCMFFSVCRPEFSEKHERLREFVMDRYSNELPNKYGLFTYVFAGNVLRLCGLQSKLNVETGVIRRFCEISALPFGYVLELNKLKNELLLNINYFAKYSYNEKANLELDLPIHVCNSLYPLDYRTKSEIIKTRNNNIKNSQL